ncbi:uncharacterized protein LOC129810342 isoform X1 [Phlebotomus papatasi]|uniref:uncharacterized protein LOC129810342 isoform X1 n=2 Tax=Phlebotomus papatasi TaxID=29031 RepID=UPI00248368E5|nr:uncharacterized protein LOC129810342 isoform X1 [Phlebotomus papatasi]
MYYMIFKHFLLGYEMSGEGGRGRWVARRRNKPKSVVHDFFEKLTEEGIERGEAVACKFCQWDTVLNATRMKKHLINDCKHAPESLRKLLQGKDKENNLFLETGELTLSQNLRKDMRASRSRSPIPVLGPSSTSNESKLHLSKSEDMKKRTDEKWARAIYATACPFSMFENKYWREALRIVNPNFQPPTRKQLAGKLLEEEYQRRLKTVDTKIQEANNLSIMCDGWSNVRNEGIINVIITTPTPVFVKSVQTGTNSQTADYIANILTETIQKYGPKKFFSVVTDNCSVNKKAWTLIQAEFEHIVCYGCMAHCLNLILTDLLNLSNVNKFVAKGKKVVVEVNNNQMVKAELLKKSGITLKLPVKTRWLSLGNFLSSLLRNKKSLKQIIIDDTFSKKISQKSKDIIMSDEFWDGVKDLHDIINLISKHIINFESNHSKISNCIPAINDIEHKVQNINMSSMFFEDKHSIISIIDKRKIFSIQKIHKLAYLLNPKHQGDSLTQEEYMDTIQFLLKISEAHLEGTSNILQELGQYKSKSGMFASKFVWDFCAETDDVVAWWKVCFPKSSLSSIAQKVLMSPPTSSAVERSFSMQKDVHSLKRNRLQNNTVAQLMHIKSDLQTTDCATGSSAKININALNNASENEPDLFLETLEEETFETLEEETFETLEEEALETLDEEPFDTLQEDTLETLEETLEEDSLETIEKETPEEDPLETIEKETREVDPLETIEKETPKEEILEENWFRGETNMITGIEQYDDIIQYEDTYDE